MKTWIIIACGIVLACLAAPSAKADFSFQFGTDDFFLSVGDYDYLPYVHRDDPGYYAPQINFYDMMSEYGRWVRVRPFGRVWRPFASYGWRPYTYGHWIYTEYGLFWEGYEPWAWVGYHFGSWIFTPRYGWVWVPGYDWHPGRVLWARGYDTLGWMPRPPDGYDYYRGDLRYVGDSDPYRYDQSDWGDDYGSDPYGYPSPYDEGRDRYPGADDRTSSFNLWIFIDSRDFTDDNYADYDLGPDYARYAFGQGMVRITDRPMERRTLERILQQPIPRIPVEMREFRSDRGTLQVAVPSGSEPIERIRRESPSVVRQVIAPAFAEEKQQFKGRNSRIQSSLDKVFRQENVQPRIEAQSSRQVIDQARIAQQKREQTKVNNFDALRQRTTSQLQQTLPGGPSQPPGRPQINPYEQRPAPKVEPGQEQGRAPVNPYEQPPAPIVEPGQEQGQAPVNPYERRPAAGVEMPRPVAPPRPSLAPERPSAPRQALPDDELSRQIRNALKTQLPKIARGIGIDAEDGVVIVSGMVANAAERDRVIQFVSTFNGVKSVKNRLTTRHILPR